MQPPSNLAGGRKQRRSERPAAIRRRSLRSQAREEV